MKKMIIFSILFSILIFCSSEKVQAINLNQINKVAVIAASGFALILYMNGIYQTIFATNQKSNCGPIYFAPFYIFCAYGSYIAIVNSLKN